MCCSHLLTLQHSTIIVLIFFVNLIVLFSTKLKCYQMKNAKAELSNTSCVTAATLMK